MLKKSVLGILVVSILVTIYVSLFGISCFAAEKEKSFNIVYESAFPKGNMRFLYTEEALDQIEEKSQGRIRFQRHYLEPVPVAEGLTALGRGVIGMLLSYPLYYSGRIAIGDWQQMPTNFKGWEDCYELAVEGRISEIMEKTYKEKANVIYLGLNPVGPYNFQVSKKSRKIRTFEDFRGLKIRVSGGAASVALEALGAASVQTISAEYYEAMQRGLVDAGLMTTYSLEQYQIWEVADQIVNPPLIGYTVGFIWMNQDIWNSLGTELQQIFIETIRSRALWEKWNAIYEQQDDKIRKTAEEKGVEFYTLPEEEAEKMYKAAAVAWDWYVEQCEKQGLGNEAKEVKKLLLTTKINI